MEITNILPSQSKSNQTEPFQNFNKKRKKENSLISKTEQPFLET